MPFELLVFLSIQFVFIIIYLVIGMIGFIRSHKVWKEALASKQYDPRPINDFLRFMARRNAVFRQISSLNVLVLVLGIVIPAIIFMQAPDLFVHGQINIINGSESLTSANIYLIIFIILFFSPLLGLSIGGNIAILLNAIFVDANASEFFHVSTLSKQDFIRSRLLLILNSALPLIIVLEATGLIATVTGQIIPALITLIIFVVALLCFRAFFGRKLLKASAYLQPIEQTRWAYLQPRIAAWSRLAGVEFQEVLIQSDTLGTNIRIAGRKKPTLIIGDWMLQYTDWRQLDAMVCVELALVKKKVLTWSFWSRLCTFISIGLIILVPIELLANGISLDFLFSMLIIFVPLLLVIFISRSFRKKMHALYLDADCISCYFTGDPMATMVALSSLRALNGVQATQKTNAIPSINARLQQLDQLAHQSWPRAPFAGELVPAITPVTFGSYQLSQDFDRQSEPAPIPDAPYVPLK